MSRRLNRGRESKKDGRHVRIYHFELATLAYRSLSPVARCLLTELKAIYNSGNNGQIFLSVRDGARLLNVGKTTIAEAYADLADRGFIRPNVPSSFDFKSGAMAGKATTWVLTEFPHGDRPPTREFQHWTPTPTSQRVPEIISRSALKDGAYPSADTLYPRPDRPRQTVPESGHFDPNSA